MARYIDADAFLARNAVYADREFDHPKYQETLREIVDKEPTLSPDEVRGVGKWMNDVGEFGFPEIPCSICGYKSGHYGFKFCPNCGARMEVSEDA